MFKERKKNPIPGVKNLNLSHFQGEERLTDDEVIRELEINFGYKTKRLK